MMLAAADHWIKATLGPIVCFAHIERFAQRGPRARRAFLGLLGAQEVCTPAR